MLYLFKQRGFGIYICVLYTLINTNLLKSRTMCNKLHTSQVYPTPLLLCFGDKLSVSLWFVAFEFEMCRLIIKISFEYKNTNNLQRFFKAQHADNFSETIMSPREIAHTELKVWNKVKPTVRLNKSTQIAKTVATYIWPTLEKKKKKKQNLPKSGPQLILFWWARSLLVYLVRCWLTSRSGPPECHHSTQHEGCLRESVKLCYLGTSFQLVMVI